tara:strand:- start:118 stop:573 length:456 start_codon:yes stop_codon:yes gene_type:complete
MVTQAQVEEAQKNWAEAIVKIGRNKADRAACEHATKETLDNLYAFDLGTVLFKPTKTSQIQFRGTYEGAFSYFIGGNSSFSEDKGFALQPWTSVRFENTGFLYTESTAVAMGNYYFYEESGAETKVEYTFGYIKNGESLKINLHHSSIPFQ